MSVWLEQSEGERGGSEGRRWWYRSCRALGAPGRTWAFIWREVAALKGCEPHRSDSGTHRHPLGAATKKTNCGHKGGSQGPRGKGRAGTRVHGRQVLSKFVEWMNKQMI